NLDLCVQRSILRLEKKMHPFGCISGAETLAAMNRFSLNLLTPQKKPLLIYLSGFVSVVKAGFRSLPGKFGTHCDSFGSRARDYARWGRPARRRQAGTTSSGSSALLDGAPK